MVLCVMFAFNNCVDWYTCIRTQIYTYSWIFIVYVSYIELPRKWRKCNLVSGHGLCGSQLGRAMNWMDRLRTNADERMLSGRHAVVIAWWAGAGFGRFFIDLSFLREQSPWSFLGLDSCVLAYCGSVHRCFPSNLSTTTQGAIVKLRGASSELCTLFIWSV